MNPTPSIPASLLSPARAEAMIALVRSRFHSPIRLLEIGVWEAAGSTQLWLEHLPAGSELVLVDAWRPYASGADLDPSSEARGAWDYARMDAQCESAFRAAVERVRAYEQATASGGGHRVHLVRAPAGEALAWMRDGSFDLVYIDGDHKYGQLLSDLHHACRLVRPDGGVLCGDDLEHLPDPERLALAHLHRDRDYLGAPHRFHPGVLLALHEVFGEVGMREGFWWVHRQGDRFSPRPSATQTTPSTSSTEGAPPRDRRPGASAVDGQAP